MSNYLTIGAFVAAGLALIVAMMSAGKTETVVVRDNASGEPRLGSIVDGYANFNDVRVKQFEYGDDTLALTPSDNSDNDGTVTLTETQLLNNSLITLDGTAATGTYTVTLPATTTLTKLMPDAANARTWFFENNETVAATTTTIVAGTGIVLLEPDGQNIVIGGGNKALLHCYRRATGGDVACSVDELIDAD